MEPGARKRAAWAVSALPRTRVVWSRPQSEIRESFRRGGQESAPSWAASDGETALRARRARGAAVCTMAWGAGRYTTPGTRRGSQAVRLRSFRSVQAGSRALGTAPAPACFWGRTLRETRTCVGDCSIKGIPAERYTAAVSNFTPPANLTFFRLCEICLCVQRTLCT